METGSGYGTCGFGGGLTFKVNFNLLILKLTLVQDRGRCYTRDRHPICDLIRHIAARSSVLCNHQSPIIALTVYPKKYAHGFCFVVAID